eukprot:7976705-Alexandrium_andersonii.AAC.1
MSRHMVLVAQALITNKIQNLAGVCDYYQNSVIYTAESDTAAPTRMSRTAKMTPPMVWRAVWLTGRP